MSRLPCPDPGQDVGIGSPGISGAPRKGMWCLVPLSSPEPQTFLTSSVEPRCRFLPPVWLLLC